MHIAMKHKNSLFCWNSVFVASGLHCKPLPYSAVSATVTEHDFFPHIYFLLVYFCHSIECAANDFKCFQLAFLSLSPKRTFLGNPAVCEAMRTWCWFDTVGLISARTNKIMLVFRDPFSFYNLCCQHINWTEILKSLRKLWYCQNCILNENTFPFFFARQLFRNWKQIMRELAHFKLL